MLYVDRAKKTAGFDHFHLLVPCYFYGTTWIHLADSGDFIGTACTLLDFWVLSSTETDMNET